MSVGTSGDACRRPAGPMGSDSPKRPTFCPELQAFSATSFLLLLVLSSLPLACSPPSHHPPASSRPPSDAATSPSSQGAEEKEPTDHGEHEDHATLVTLTPEARAGLDLATVPVELWPFVNELQTTGHVDFDQDRVVHVSPRLSGRLQEVAVRLGQRVRVDQVLATLDSIELGQAKAEYLHTKAQEELQRTRFERAESLLAADIASQQSVLEVEAELKVAIASLRSAAETLQLFGLSRAEVDTLSYEGASTSRMELRAPLGGTVIERHATLGELVTPEDRLFTLADLSRLWIWIDIPQRELASVHLDDVAEARVDTFPNQVFAGSVSYLSPQVDQTTRTVRARLDVANPHGKLRPGMFVQVGLLDPHGAHGDGEGTSVLTVPETAIQRHGDEDVVFVPLDDLRFERRAVELGRRSAGRVEVLQGVQAGDRVVTQGAFLLKSSLSKDSLGGGHSH